MFAISKTFSHFTQALLIACLLVSFSQAAQTQSASDQSNLANATFAGGCFWCMEHAFDEVEGVVSTISGFTGGHVENPTYKQVSRGGTGHTEVVQIRYDPDIVSYEKLLSVFWRNIDPTTPNQQFCDVGNQYRSAIFFHDAEQRQLAQKSKTDIEQNKTFDEPVATLIDPLTKFYSAEEYHQDYHHKKPFKYKFYRKLCGRDKRLNELWGDRTG